MLKIDKGVPLPKSKSRHPKGRTQSPDLAIIDAMEEGDSILFDSDKEAHIFQLRAYYYLPREFYIAMRKSREGWRVWKMKRGG